jgi:Hint module
MKDVVVGNKVLTDVKSNRYEEVYALGHRDPIAKTTFLQIHTQHQSTPLEMTGDHMLSVNGRFAKASAVQVGDTLQGGEGVPTKVTKIGSVSRHDGVYAPLTSSGTLLVDNVLASAYVSLQEKGNEYPMFANGLPVPISQQFGIHMLLSPYRMLCMGLKLDSYCHSKTENGISSYVHAGIQLAKYADTLSLSMQLVLLTLAVVLIVPMYVLETAFGARFAPLALFLGVLGIGWFNKRRMESKKK